MRLYLIRHGQSINNALYAEGREKERQFDPELTDIGKQQAQHVAQYIAEADDMPSNQTENFNLTHLYCSAMVRAMQTAQPIAQALGIQPEVWVDVHEIGGLFLADDEDNITAYPGMNRTEIGERFADYVLPEQVTDVGWWDTKQLSESPPETVARAVRVAHILSERAHTDEHIGLVSHGAFMDLLIKAFLSRLPSHPESLFFTHYNTAITRIDFGEGYQGATVGVDRIRIHYQNRVQHLPSNLWTW